MAETSKVSSEGKFLHLAMLRATFSATPASIGTLYRIYFIMFPHKYGKGVEIFDLQG